jgi:WD40 repeat protein/serine/threonine protein kinase/tetratricopeptide (TPR) repeat protein
MEQRPITPPLPEELRAYSLGRCSGQRALEIEAFLAGGADRGSILAAAPDDAVVRHLRGAGTLPVNAAGEASTLPRDEGSVAQADFTPLGYEVLGELGRGGMGVVYLARQVALCRTVALKMILAGRLAGDEERQRFLAEAEAVAALNHPGIVQVFERGTHDGRPFFSLEFCPGGSLASKLADNPMPPREAARLVEQVTRAVQAAHDRGIVHRDLKPDNVLIAEDGAPKVTDFGLAKRMEVADGLTVTGAVLGTPSYIAPEQAQGSKDVGPAADVYALGAILYECLTGRPPFKAATTHETLLQVIGDEPVPPRRLNTRAPADLETISLRCLQKTPKQRYATAGQLADDLARFLRGEPIVARPVGTLERGWRWCRRNRSLAAAVGLALTGLLGSLVLSISFAVSEAANSRRLARLQEKTEDALHEAREKGDLAQQRWREARSEEAALALDHGLRLCAQEEGPHGLLWLARSLDLAEQALAEDLARAARWNLGAWSQHLPRVQCSFPHPDKVGALAARPGGRVVVTGCDDGNVRFWDPDSGRQIDAPLAHGSPILDVHYTPDGRVLLVACADGRVHQWNALTRTRSGPALPHLRPVSAVTCSHDGGVILTACEDRQIRAWDAASARLLGPPAQDPHTGYRSMLTLLPDGKHVAHRSANRNPTIWEVGTGRPVPPLHRGDWVGTAIPWGTESDVLVTGDDFQIAFRDAQTGAVRGQVQVHACEYIAFSQDWRRLLYVSRGGKIVVLDRSSLKQSAPALWLQSGVRHAIFTADGKGVVACDNGKLVRSWRLAPPDAPRWRGEHPEATSVACRPGAAQFASAGFDQMVRLWDLPSGKVVKTWPHPTRVLSLAFSPDGRLLLTGGDDQTHLWDVNTGKPYAKRMKHADSVWSVRFSQDGKYFSGGTWSGFVRVGDTATGKPTGVRVEHPHSSPTLGIDFTPDGKSLLTGGSDGSLAVWQRESGAPVGKPRLLHRDSICTILFSRKDPNHLLTASYDGKAQLWDAHTFQAVGPPLLHNNPLRAAVFGPQEEIGVTGGEDRAAFLWHLPTGKLVGPPRKHPWIVTGVAFHSGDGGILTAGEGGVCAWEFPQPVEGDPDHVRLWAERLTGMRLEGNNTLTVLDAEALALHDRRLREATGFAIPREPRDDGRKPLTEESDAAQANYERGTDLLDGGRAEEAIACYRKAIALRPEFAEAFCQLGAALRRRGDLTGSLAAYRRGHELGSRLRDWDRPSGQWVVESQRLVELDGKLPAFLQGKWKPSGGKEQCELARLCALKHGYETATRLFREALAAEPNPASDPRSGLRFAAACACARSSEGAGDAWLLSPEDRLARRQQALTWLRAELAAWSRLLEKATRDLSRQVEQELQHWQRDIDLAGVRDEAALAQMTAAERAAFRAFWTDVDAILRKIEEEDG